MTRSAVLLLDRGRVALMRRVRPDRGLYFVFPGGHVEPGEAPEAAAVREAYEELGVRVSIIGLCATEHFNGNLHGYYWASLDGGVFGSGTGPEMSTPPGSPNGTYSPVWVPVSDLPTMPVVPRRLAHMLARGERPREPFEFVDDPA